MLVCKVANNLLLLITFAFSTVKKKKNGKRLEMNFVEFSYFISGLSCLCYVMGKLKVG